MAKLHKKKLIIIIASVAIILAGVSAATYFIFFQKQAETSESTEPELDTSTLGGQFQQKIAAGDKEGAVSLFDNAINTAEDEDGKNQYRQQRTTALANAGMYEEALESSLDAEKQASTHRTLYDVAVAYGDLGNTQKQIEYLKRAVQSITTDGSETQVAKDYFTNIYNEIIASLETN